MREKSNEREKGKGAAVLSNLKERGEREENGDRERKRRER